MSQPIKAVLFDFGRVLCLFDRLRAMRQILAHSNVSMTPESLDAELFALDGLGTLFESGKLTQEEFFKQLYGRYQLNPSLKHEDLMQMWGQIFDEVPGAESVVKTIPDTIQCGILSNIDPIHWSVAKDLDVIRSFNQDLVIKSFEQKTRKPDARMYEVAKTTFGVEAQHILYLDDIHEYVDKARSLGLNAEQFDARTMNAEDMRRILSSYGILQ